MSRTPSPADHGSVEALAARLAERGGRGAEANVQADIRQFLLAAPLSLEPGDIAELEVRVGEGQRIDVEVGATVIEVKRDLRKGTVREDARKQLAGYVGKRERETGSRYVGVLTDGAEWLCHHLDEDELVEVSALTLDGRTSDLARLSHWLEGVLATTRNAKPTPRAIESGLGAGSSAHAVLGLPIESLSPTALLTGMKFDEVGVHGVVEMDFFDWVLDVPVNRRGVGPRIGVED